MKRSYSRYFSILFLALLFTAMQLGNTALFDDSSMSSVAYAKKDKGNDRKGKKGLRQEVKRLEQFLLDVQQQIDELELQEGPQGPAGPQGPQGETGPVGPKGPIGLTGPAGPAGADGTDGADGAQGLQGATGPAGPAGADGANGANGADGADGADGAQGPQGETGPAGPIGPQGIQGPIGAQGPQGLPGADGADGGDETSDGVFINKARVISRTNTTFTVEMLGSNLGIIGETPTVTLSIFSALNVTVNSINSVTAEFNNVGSFSTNNLTLINSLGKAQVDLTVLPARSRFIVDSGSVFIPSNGIRDIYASCPAGSKLISGGYSVHQFEMQVGVNLPVDNGA